MKLNLNKKVCLFEIETTYGLPSPFESRAENKFANAPSIFFQKFLYSSKKKDFVLIFLTFRVPRHHAARIVKKMLINLRVVCVFVVGGSRKFDFS